MDQLMSDIAKKKHKKKQVKKKQPKTKAERPVKHNTKAFTFSGGRVSVHRRVQHASEVEEKRLKRPQIFKTPETPPPIVIVVQGPKSVGKSTLIKSIVKQYSKRNVNNINGPITLVSSKSRRLTIVECGNSMLDMIDCCKIADIAIIMIDGSYGYEMETFEFVNMMQVHGFPRVIGVMTHLDAFKDNKTMRRTKKIIKKRFWTEIYEGAKMFYFTGVQHERYKKNEIQNLTRYISSQKPPNISWRISHPYTVSLRHEITETEDDKCKVSFYGYVYGGKMNTTQGIHIPGAGDFKITSITNFQDPCEVNPKERTLKDKNRNIYAPYCEVGTLVLDDDAMYIQLFKTKEHFTEMPNEDKNNISEAVQMVRTLQKIDQFKTKESKIKIVEDSQENTNKISENTRDAKESNALADSDTQESEGDEEFNSAIEESEEEDYEDEYQESDGSALEESESDQEVGNDIFKTEEDRENNHFYQEETTDEIEDSSLEEESSSSEDEDDISEGIKTHDESAHEVYFEESLASDSSFKDYSKAAIPELDKHLDLEGLKRLREEKFLNLSDDIDEMDQDDENENDYESEKYRKIQEEEQKRLFNETLELDPTGNVGYFVKIVVNEVPSSFIDNVNTKSRPIILGCIQQSEQGCGFIQIKLKRHRWFPKILKTNDPLLFSVGWRRFQSLPVYCIEDRNQSRVKMLKYTPEHLHCLANIYGPLSPPSFGILAVKNWDRISNYRISASGVTVGTNQSYKILKKLKLIGEPYKIMKNTSFIKNMFNSELEVIKCIGSKIQTASGIRGQIKKPIDKNGAFRATFEDKILLSDLVILKSWINVETKEFYNLIIDSEKFKRVKSISELKKGEQIKSDSKYEMKELIRRPAHRFNEIKIPKPIIEKLPFSSKPKVIEQDKDLEIKPEASEQEKKIGRIFQKLHTIRKDRLDKRKVVSENYKLQKAREKDKSDQVKREKQRQIKRMKFSNKSKIEKIKHSKLLLD